MANSVSPSSPGVAAADPVPRPRGYLVVGARLLRVVCGTVLLAASLGKLRQPYDFLIAFYKFDVLGPPAGRHVAMVLPFVELFTGVALLGGVLLRGALWVNALLHATFALAVASVLVRQIAVDCACFGVSGEQVGGTTLARNALFLALGCTALALHPKVPARADA